MRPALLRGPDGSLEADVTSLGMIVYMLQFLEMASLALVVINVVNMNWIRFLNFDISEIRAMWSYVVYSICGEVRQALVVPSALLLFLEYGRDEEGREVPTTVTSLWGATRLYGVLAIGLHYLLKANFTEEYELLCDLPPLHGVFFTMVVASAANFFHFIMLPLPEDVSPLTPRSPRSPRS